MVIPGNVHHVGSYAFYKCANLRALVVEDGVAKVMGSAFSGCPRLESVYLSKTLTYIGPDAFRGLTFLDEGGNPLDHTRGNLRGHAFSGSGGTLRMMGEISDGETFQADGISYTITSKDALAVSATGYEGAVAEIPSSVSYKGWELSVESVGSKAFLRCETLTAVDLSNVRVLEYKALGNCAGIEDIIFGDELESIGDYALHGLSFYDGDVKLSATPDALRGHSFSGTEGKLYLVA